MTLVCLGGGLLEGRRGRLQNAVRSDWRVGLESSGMGLTWHPWPLKPGLLVDPLDFPILFSHWESHTRPVSTSLLRTPLTSAGVTGIGLGFTSVKYKARESSKREGGTFSFKCRSSHCARGEGGREVGQGIRGGGFQVGEGPDAVLEPGHRFQLTIRILANTNLSYSLVRLGRGELFGLQAERQTSWSPSGLQLPWRAAVRPAGICPSCPEDQSKQDCSGLAT